MKCLGQNNTVDHNESSGDCENKRNIPQYNEDNRQYPKFIFIKAEDSWDLSTLQKRDKVVQSLHTNLLQSSSAYKDQVIHRIFSIYQERI